MCSLVNLEGNNHAWCSSRLHCCFPTLLHCLHCLYCLLFTFLCMTISRLYVSNLEGLTMSMSCLLSSSLSSVTLPPWSNVNELFVPIVISFIHHVPRNIPWLKLSPQLFVVFGDTLIEIIHDSLSTFFHWFSKSFNVPFIPKIFITFTHAMGPQLHPSVWI